MAQPACWPRDILAAKLLNDYREAPAWQGLAAPGLLLDVFTTPDGETWTMTLTNPAGCSVVIAVGEHWQPAPAVQGDAT